MHQSPLSCKRVVTLHKLSSSPDLAFNDILGQTLRAVSKTAILLFWTLLPSFFFHGVQKKIFFKVTNNGNRILCVFFHPVFLIMIIVFFLVSVTVILVSIYCMCHVLCGLCYVSFIYFEFDLDNCFSIFLRDFCTLGIVFYLIRTRFLFLRVPIFFSFFLSNSVRSLIWKLPQASFLVWSWEFPFEYHLQTTI